MSTVFYQTFDKDGVTVLTSQSFNVYSTIFKDTDVLLNPAGIAALVQGNVDSSQWTLSGDYANPVVSQLSAADFTAQLQMVQGQILEVMGERTFSYIESKYVDRLQRCFTFLYTESSIKGQAQATALIQSAWDWTVSVVDGFYAARDKVLAAQKIADAQAVVLDLSPYDATDPKVTLEQVFAAQGRPS